MQSEKITKSVQLQIPALHTYMIKQDDKTSTEQVKISLINGEAEILGMQMKKFYPLRFKMPCIILIFTWEGCEVKVEWPEDKGGCSSEQWCDITMHYHLSESPMIKYLTLHYELTVGRRLAQEELKKGPRLAIVGGENSGTNYASRLMLNYAGKLNMRPLYVDLDLDNSIFLDGSIGAAAYQYKVTTSQDLFEKVEKICFIYGNRRIRTASFLRLARQLSKNITSRLDLEMQNARWKGCSEQISSFASGLIVQCPRISDQKKHLKEMLAQLLAIFQITHVLIIDNPQISSYLTRNCPNIQRFNTSRIEGVENLLKLQKKNKLVRYFGSQQYQTLKLKISDVILYELIENQNKNAYVRIIDLKTELVNKTTVSILHAQSSYHVSIGENSWNSEEIAKRISESTVAFGCRISKIQQQQVTFEVPSVENFYQLCKNKIWVSMIAER